MKNTIKQTTSGLLIISIIGVSCTKKQNMCLPQATNFRQGTTLCLQKTGRDSSCSLPDPSRVAMVGFQDVREESFISDPSLNLEIVGSVFSDVLTQGTSLWGRYFTDGQFAYTNAVRRYIEDKYHYTCDKVFLFGEMTATSPHYGCVATWKYDVACVIHGDQDYVIDPRLFNKVVTVDQWKAVHYMRDLHTVPKLQIVPGAYFAPRDLYAHSYLVDSGYVYTDIVLEHYRDSVGCASQPLVAAVTR